MTTDTDAQLRHAIGPDGLFVLAVSDGDVRIRGVAGDEVTIRTRGGGSLAGLDIERGSQSLSVRNTGDRGPGHRRRSSTSDLDIGVPAGATVSIEVASSDLRVDGLTGDQRYRSASGDISLRDGSGTIAVEAMSGDVEISTTGRARFETRTVSGDLEIRGEVIERLQVATTSGDILLSGRYDGPGPFTVETMSGDTEIATAGDLRVDVRTLAGDLHSRLPGRIEEHAGGRSFVLGTGEPVIDVRSTSGDVRVTPAETSTRHAQRDQSAAPTTTAAETAPPTDDVDLEVLRALERGDIDLDEARVRLAARDETTDAEARDEAAQDEAPTVRSDDPTEADHA